MLKLDNVHTAYGQSQVLFGMNLEVRAGEVVTLLGRNGMGKTTTIRSVIGLTPAHKGTITFEGADIHKKPAYQIARMGIGLVPEGRQIFPNLSVRENIVATARRPRDEAEGWTFEKTMTLFPRLRERLGSMGNQLSGGEQQMLAIARALMTNPRLLILDEATEGLAPMIRKEIWDILGALKQDGQSILVIDKNVDALMRISDRHYIIERGKVVWQGTSAKLRRNKKIMHDYLGV